MAQTFAETVVLVKVECGCCGAIFAMNEGVHTLKQQNGGIFYCPNGDRISYSANENAKLRGQLLGQQRETAKQRENYFAEQRKHEETQRKMLRVKKRVAAGTCPCCKRTFSQMARHMKTKHPDYPGKP